MDENESVSQLVDNAISMNVVGTISKRIEFKAVDSFCRPDLSILRVSLERLQMILSSVLDPIFGKMQHKQKT